MNWLPTTAVHRRRWVCSKCRSQSLSTTPRHAVSERRSAEKLPDKPARTRFAPSPTGYLHLGSLRTAVFNYLTAKATGGQFILRIEDTDKKRLISDAEARLCEDLKWAGIQWDEGPDIGGPYGPYRQSQRTSLYKGHAQTLINTGHAYRCFCSPARLNSLAGNHHLTGLRGGYDRACADIPYGESEERAIKGEAHVIRLKMPGKSLAFTDLTYGVVNDRLSAKRPTKGVDSHGGFEDPVLFKSDGLPTYHLANVVDDHSMGITHVIRASEWMSSTSKHLAMYNAFGWKPPTYAHVGLLQDGDNQKLSKRIGSDSIGSYRQSGIFPETLVNFLALLGWSHKLTSDFLRMQDLIQNFDLKFTKGNTKIGLQKLAYLQKRYAAVYAKEKGKEYEEMVNAVYDIALHSLHESPESSVVDEQELRQVIERLISTQAKHYASAKNFFERYVDLFHSRHRLPWDGKPEDSRMLPDLTVIREEVENIPAHDWSDQIIQQVLDRLRQRFANLAKEMSGDGIDRQHWLSQYMRWALTGGRPGASLSISMACLGRRNTILRLESGEIEFRSLRKPMEY